MKNSSSSSSSSGIGFAGLLTVILVALKLTHFIDWSWWWITAPLWGSVVIAVVLFVVGFTVTMAVLSVSRAKTARENASIDAVIKARTELSSKLREKRFKV